MRDLEFSHTDQALAGRIMYRYWRTTLHSYGSLMLSAALALAASLLYFYGSTFAEISEPLPAPVIDTRASSYDPAESRLILKGANFRPGTTVVLKKSTEILTWRVLVVIQFLLNRTIALRDAARDVRHGPVEVIDSRNIIVR